MVREEKRGEKRRCNGERHRDGETDRDSKEGTWGRGREREEGVEKGLRGCQEVGRRERRTSVGVEMMRR